MSREFREQWLYWLKKESGKEDGPHTHTASSLAPAPAARPTPDITLGPAPPQYYSEHVAKLAVDFAVDLTAGSAGAIVSVYIGQPMDTVKVKMQAFPHIHTTMVRCVVRTFLREGMRGLYAGTVPALAANIAENSVLFAAYGMCQRVVANICVAESPDALSTLGNASAGFLAAFFSSLTLCPTELIKCRLQAMHELHQERVVTRTLVMEPMHGPWSMTRHILDTEGMAGLYRGLTSTFAREMPGYFFFFGGYELGRSMFTSDGQSKGDIGYARTFLCGGLAGVCLWTAVFPTDVIKSRIQVTGSTVPMLRVASQIYRNEGVLAFYNGLWPTVIRTFPATGLLLVTYEFVKKSLHERYDL